VEQGLRYAFQVAVTAAIYFAAVRGSLVLAIPSGCAAAVGCTLPSSFLAAGGSENRP